MNAYLNYLLEASIGLCLFLLVYKLFLSKETSFRLNRIFLLVAIIASVTFPLLKLNTADSPVPSLSFSVEPADTDELIYTNDSTLAESHLSLTTWEILAIFYAAGLLVFFVVFIIRLSGMLKALKQAAAYTYDNHHIVELKNQDSPFSFFNYIFIGSTPPLSEKEKQQIIEHESIHAKLYHSVDIVLLNILGIIFWFNPIIRIYKKIFVQLHEFEADARAVEAHDVDAYCSLLARVALHSTDYKLANHFSNSLTVKRIEMMRTLKQKIKNWKIAAVAGIIPIIFFVIACQDQVESPYYIEEDGRQPLSENVLISSQPIQDRIDALNKSNPDKHYIAIEINYFIESDQETKKDNFKFRDELKKYDLPEIIEFHYEDIDDPKAKPGFRRFAIVDINQGKTKVYELPTKEEWKQAVQNGQLEIAEEDAKLTVHIDGPIFTKPEQQAVPPGGLAEFTKLLKRTAKYPETSKQAGIEGKVFIRVTITKEGKPVVFEIIKGVNNELDQEALRIIKTNSKGWKAAIQNGHAVNSQLVLNVQFKL